MAFTQSDLTALEKALAAGVTQVRYADRTITYRTLAEMQSVRQMIKQELGLETTGFAHYTPGFTKGL